MTSAGLSCQFLRVLSDSGLFSEKTSVLTAFSGGADSVSLLCLLQSAQKQLPFSLSALHVHHGIRGEEADRDAEFCRAFCTERNIPFTLCRTDVPALAAVSGRSIEEEAREERYRLLSEHLAAHPEITVLLTAHHADDQAETVLFRLLRGTDLRGLSGISPLRAFPLPDGRSVSLFRPLLSFTKENLLAYCRENGASYVTDSTNFETVYTRSRIRSVLIPEAKTVNPDFSRALIRLSHAAQRDEDYFQAEIEKLLPCFSDLSALPLEPLRALHPALRTRLLTALHEKALMSLRGVSRSVCPPGTVHIRAMEEAVFSASEPKTLYLPGDLLFSVYPAGGTCSFSAFSRDETPDFSFPVLYPEEGNPVYLPDGSACLVCDGTIPSQSVQDLKNIYKFFISARINSDTIKDKVFLRPRADNKTDTYLCGGSRKTAKDTLSAHKVPPEHRKRIPLFCDGDGLLWVPFCGIADRVNPKYRTSSDVSGNNFSVFYYFYGSKGDF